MKSISKLKDEARRHEQREEWEKAIAAYLQVLRIADEGETEVELPLYNRLGDLCVRLGKPQEAVRHYEQAADRYAEAGLYNNAIALCNKALRYSPDRLELIRKLGQFSASQGFITDARRYFLDYAERQFKAGKVSDALSALEDFANVSDDAEVRELLGRQLQAHGRINDAVDELRRAHALRLRDGQTAQAETLRREILAIDPNAKLDAGAAAPAVETRAQPGPALPGLVDIEPEPPETPPAGAARGAVEGLETGALPGQDGADIDSIQLAGFETTEQPDLADIDVPVAGGVEGLETTTFDFDEVAPETPTLDDLGLERETTSFDGKIAPGEADAFDLPTLDDPAGGFDLPTLDDPETPTDLPLLDDPESTDLPTLDAPRRAADLPTLDEPEAAADLPLLDDPDSSELPDSPDGAFDLPLLGDDEPTDVVGETAPMPRPEFDDAPSVDPTPPAETRDFGLGGDLPLDLNSLGGFDLPAPEGEAVDTPDWERDESAFDIPELDGESLGLPTWEPTETAPSFDLPSFEMDVEETVEEEAAAVEEEGAAEVEQPAARAESPPTSSAPPADAVTPHVEPSSVEIPAIELPTWDTGLVLGSEQESDAAVDDEAAEPFWVESIADEDEDVSPELPTFTYEDDATEGEETGGAAEDTAAAAGDPSRPDEVDDDPLGLAAHLPGYTAPDALPPAGDAASPVESDWLDDLAEEDAAAPGDAGAAAADAALDASTDDSEPAAEEGSVPAASVEDTSAAAARAAEAADDMSDAPWAQSPGTTEADVPPAKPAAPPAAATPPTAGPGDRQDYVDLGALVADEGEEENTRFRVQETPPTGDEDRDFAELLSQFKSKVHEHLPAEDAAAHYDLGLAFKEMGLIDEAIGEFQIALRAGHMRLKVYEELGQCFLQKEQFNIAEKVLSRALTMKFNDELELLGVYYHLGRAYEALGRRDQARDAYERVLGMDINFGDVTDRLARL